MSWRNGAETMVGHTGFILGIVAAVMAIILAYVKLSIEATMTLILFSLYWLRDVVRMVKPIGRKKAAGRVDDETVQKRESNPR